MAVSGHVSQEHDGSDNGFEAAAWKECEEEIGLSKESAERTLVERGLLPVGRPYFCWVGRSSSNPPFLDAEVRQIFHGTITGEGLQSIRFKDAEVTAVTLMNRDSAWGVLFDPTIGSGLRFSLPRYLDWLEQSRLQTQ